MEYTDVNGSTQMAAKNDKEKTLKELERETSVFVRRALRRLWNEEGDSGVLDRWTYAVLVRLSDGPKRVGEVARMFAIDKSTASRHVKRIVEGGLAEAVPDEQDARSTIVRITVLGIERLAEARTAHMEPVSRVFAAWPEEDRQTLARLLARLNADLDKLGEAQGKKAEE